MVDSKVTEDNCLSQSEFLSYLYQIRKLFEIDEQFSFDKVNIKTIFVLDTDV